MFFKNSAQICRMFPKLYVKDQVCRNSHNLTKIEKHCTKQTCYHFHMVKPFNKRYERDIKKWELNKSYPACNPRKTVSAHYPSLKVLIYTSKMFVTCTIQPFQKLTSSHLRLPTYAPHTFFIKVCAVGSILCEVHPFMFLSLFLNSPYHFLPAPKDSICKNPLMRNILLNAS